MPKTDTVAYLETLKQYDLALEPEAGCFRRFPQKFRYSRGAAIDG